jgi:hypothetical protein
MLVWVDFCEQASALRLLAFGSAVHSMLCCDVLILRDKSLLWRCQFEISFGFHVQVVNIVSWVHHGVVVKGVFHGSQAAVTKYRMH